MKTQQELETQKGNLNNHAAIIMDQLSEVVKYILYRSRENNTPVTEIMATFLAQIIYNPRTRRFYLEEKLSESQLAELKELAIKKVFNRESPQMKTIDLQITYDTEFLDAELKKQQRTRNQSLDSGKLIDDVLALQVKNAKDFEGLTQLYKKIFNFLLFKNKQLADRETDASDSDEQNRKVEKEVAAALESVIPRAALGPFVTLNNSEKVTQLIQLSNLVIGIRLFNQEIGKGGASLTPMAQLVSPKSRQFGELAQNELADITVICEKYTVVFKAEDEGIITLRPDEFQRFKNELTFFRQYNSFLVNLVQEIQLSQRETETNEEKFHKEISDLKNLLGSKSSAPKEQVYPRFAILAQAYTQLFQERKLSDTRAYLFGILTQFRINFPMTLTPTIINKAVAALQNRPQAAVTAVEYDPDSGVQMFSPQTSPDFMQKTCDYLGFCIWTIVKKNGLLMSGEPKLGVFKFKDKNCVFSSEKAVNQFLSDPEHYVNSVLDVCRKNPELIHFLRLDENFKNVKLGIVNQVVEGETSVRNKLMLDKEIETPVHFIEKNLDPNYFWNEWELRKKAIQMANIRKNQTKACQTILSNFRVDSDTQTYLKKDVETNTMGSVGVQFRGERRMKDSSV